LVMFFKGVALFRPAVGVHRIRPVQ
jgi:hypothetical protein